jgi:thiol-disulfide isomerase/thioredoxin
LIEGGENEFMQNNFFLPFRLPAIISNEPSFKSKMVQRAYDLQIPEDSKLQDIYKEYLRNVLSLVHQYPNSFHILNTLYDRANNITLKTLDTAITIFNEKVLNTVTGRKLKTYIANGKWLLNKPDLNKVRLSITTGNELLLGSLIDSTKFTFIDFWTSWCVPCRAFSTSLAQKYSDLDTNKIQIISISIDEDTEKWKTALAKDKLPWLNYIDPSLKGFKGDLASLFNIQFIPQSFLFDKNGNIFQMNM